MHTPPTWLKMVFDKNPFLSNFGFHKQGLVQGFNFACINSFWYKQKTFHQSSSTLNRQRLNNLPNNRHCEQPYGNSVKTSVELLKGYADSLLKDLPETCFQHELEACLTHHLWKAKSLSKRLNLCLNDGNHISPFMEELIYNSGSFMSPFNFIQTGL